MFRISFAVVAAAMAFGALATTANAAGCHHGGFGIFRQSYAANQSSPYEIRRLKQRRAFAAARTRSKPQVVAVQTTAPVAPKTNVTPTSSTAIASTTSTPTATVAKKGDLITETTVAKTETGTTDKADAGKGDTQTVVAQVCRKFSPATGGLVETTCN